LPHQFIEKVLPIPIGLRPGAGGYGDPKKRERARVKQDLDDEKISPQAAKRDYGWEG